MKRILKLCMTLIVLTLCFSGGFTVVKAGNVYQEGGFEYSLENGKVTIVKYRGSESELTVPAVIGGRPVVKVEAWAFEQNNNLYSVAFPDTISYIGDSALRGCRNLKKVHLPEALSSIEEQTFTDCTSLKEVDFPSNLDYIKYGAFINCESLESVMIPKVVSIELAAFFNCKSLKSVMIHSGLKSIQGFEQCICLRKIILPKGTQKIGSSCFSGCKSLQHIILPSSLKEIEINAFCGSGLVEVTVPASVTSFGMCVFDSCADLKTVNFYGHCMIDFKTFSNCTSLTTVNISSNVKGMEQAFQGTTKLETLRIPSSVNVAWNAFGRAEMLHTIYGVKGSTAQIAAQKAGIAFVAVKDIKISLNKKSGTLYMAKGKDFSYLKATVSGTDSVPIWSSSNVKVVQVSTKGKLTAKGVGTATITAYVGGEKTTCKITVKNPSLKQTTVNLSKGKKYTIRFTDTPLGNVTYKSSKTSVAKVDSKGKVVAVNKGTAIITVNCNGASQKLKVIVK